MAAYPPIPDAAQGFPDEAAVRDFLLDLAARKEFRSLAAANNRPGAQPEGSTPLSPYGIGPATPVIAGLRLHGAQVFVSNFSTPNTPYSRLLLNWQTGTGKTIAAIAIAQEYAQQFRSRFTLPAGGRPTVFIIGFTKSIIQEEMLRHPEFGFASPREVSELRRLSLLAEASGGLATPEARQYSGYLGILKRRITDRAQGGYYQFYGYKEFAARLFVVTQRGTTRGFSVADLYAREGVAAGEEEDGGFDAEIATTDPSFLERINTAVEAGDVGVNTELLESLKGGLIVADEIHNTYNIKAKNNYGVAIQYALDRIAADDPAATPRALYMSATATGGVATEVVDLLNLLVPVDQLPGRRRLRRSDYFQTEMAAGGSGRRAIVLQPGALDRIGLLAAGRVSFLHDSDEAAYPRRIIEGTAVPNPLRPGTEIAYLRFIPCPMTPFHEKTLHLALEEARAKGGGSDRATLPAGAYSLYDMAYPNPAYPPEAAGAPSAELQATGAHGLYLSSETPAKLAMAPVAWKAAAGVVVNGLGGGRPALITGPFLSLGAQGPPGIGAYSAKYQALAADLIGILRSGPGKVLIYHHRVRMSGVLQIQELLEMNGFLSETASPAASTLCAFCGAPRSAHAAPPDQEGTPRVHAYKPARYLIVNSEIDRSALDRSIGRFNAQTNTEGYEYRVLIGSKLIREGFDLKAVRHLLISSLPTDIPTLIQVFGRAVRKGSHLALPEAQRDVRIRIYVSTAGSFSLGQGPAPEILRYAEKMEMYFLTQEVEAALRRTAVDAFVHLGRAGLPAAATIDAAPFRPLVTRADALQRPQTVDTFEAMGHGDREIAALKAVIRALFETQPVWTYPDLWAAARSGRVAGVPWDPGSFSEDSYALALDSLGYHPPNTSSPGDGDAREAGFLISRVDRFYIRTPVGPTGRPVLDVESYLRDNEVLAPLRVHVSEHVRASRLDSNFATLLAKFEQDFGRNDTPPIEEIFVRYGAEFHYGLLRALVEGAAGGALDDVDGPAAVYRKASSGQVSAFARALDVYVRFRVIVLGAAIAASPEARKLVRAHPAFHANSRTPVGYVGETTVRLLQPLGGEWYDIPRKVLDIGARYVENSLIVGYVERRGNNLRFKLRPPIHKLSAAAVRDSRSLARGAACETRPRAELISLVRELEGHQLPEKTPADSLTGAELCTAIRLRLLALEEDARRPVTGMAEGLRWFYLFNDRLPTVALNR
jgi:hypothetical protein